MGEPASLSTYEAESVTVPPVWTVYDPPAPTVGSSSSVAASNAFGPTVSIGKLRAPPTANNRRSTMPTPRPKRAVGRGGRETWPDEPLQTLAVGSYSKTSPVGVGVL